MQNVSCSDSPHPQASLIPTLASCPDSPHPMWKRMLPPRQKSIFKMWLANETLTLSILQVKIRLYVSKSGCMWVCSEKNWEQVMTLCRLLLIVKWERDINCSMWSVLSCFLTDQFAILQLIIQNYVYNGVTWAVSVIIIALDRKPVVMCSWGPRTHHLHFCCLWKENSIIVHTYYHYRGGVIYRRTGIIAVP